VLAGVAIWAVPFGFQPVSSATKRWEVAQGSRGGEAGIHKPIERLQRVEMEFGCNARAGGWLGRGGVCGAPRREEETCACIRLEVTPSPSAGRAFAAPSIPSHSCLHSNVAFALRVFSMFACRRVRGGGPAMAKRGPHPH
jgi:hypothetical protein